MKKAILKARNPDFLKENAWETVESLISYKDEETSPILQDHTVSQEVYELWTSVVSSALRNAGGKETNEMKKAILKARNPDFLKENAWETVESLISYKDEETLPVLQDETLSEGKHKLWTSVAMTAFENVLKDEDKKTELELTKPAFLWNDEDKQRQKEEDKKRQEREERRTEAAERVLLELVKVRPTEEAEVSTQLSKLKYQLDLKGNKQLKETLKKNKLIPQNIKKSL